MATLKEVQDQISMAGMSAWIRPHKNESTVTYKGHRITVAQDSKSLNWSWEVAGEDNTGCASKESALGQAKEMVDSMTRDWDK